MLCEQTFLNAGPLLVKATEGSGGAALAGFTFNVLLIARAPLQLFQAIQTSILPHLTRLRASGESDPFRRSVNLTLTAIAGFAGCVALVMLVAGPQLMDLLFGGDFDYERGGLVLVSVGMGLYLSAATLNQALLAHGLAAQASACWISAAAGFVLFLLLADFNDRVLQVELAFVGAAALLSAALYRSTAALNGALRAPAAAARVGRFSFPFRKESAHPPYAPFMAKHPDVGDPAPDFELEGTAGQLPALGPPWGARRAALLSRRQHHRLHETVLLLPRQRGGVRRARGDGGGHLVAER